MKLYVDGVLAGSATGSTASLTSPTTIEFGRILTGNKYFAGFLDEVAVHNTPLSGSTVTSTTTPASRPAGRDWGILSRPVRPPPLSATLTVTRALPTSI
jgi:hypothetical protein